MIRAPVLAILLTCAGCDSNPSEPSPVAASDSSAADTAVAGDASSEDAAVAEVEVDAGPDAPSEDAAYVRPDTIDVPPLIGFDAGVLPKDDAGRPTLSKGTGIALVLGMDGAKRGPATALAGCAGLISGCYEPGKRSLDACVISMPRCATSKPWEESAPCCPTACVDRYEAARIAGVIPQQAIYTVLFKTPRCLPGLDSALGVK